MCGNQWRDRERDLFKIRIRIQIQIEKPTVYAVFETAYRKHSLLTSFNFIFYISNILLYHIKHIMAERVIIHFKKRYLFSHWRILIELRLAMSRRAVIVSTARTGLAKSFRGGFNNTHGIIVFATFLL
jgi:hypothetical protein